MLYLDTSLLVAVFTDEAAADRLLAWLKRSQSEGLTISEWVATEFSAALSMKIRTKHIDESYRARAFALFERMAADSMRVTTVTDAHFRSASQFASEYRLGLRAGDALHLAIASDQDAILCTLDKRLAGAGKTLGVATQLV